MADTQKENNTGKLWRWGQSGYKIWSIVTSLGVPAMVKAIFHFANSWQWYNQVLLFGGLFLVLLGISMPLACFLQVGIPHFCKTFSPAPVGKIKLT